MKTDDDFKEMYYLFNCLREDYEDPDTEFKNIFYSTKEHKKYFSKKEFRVFIKNLSYKELFLLYSLTEKNFKNVIFDYPH